MPDILIVDNLMPQDEAMRLMRALNNQGHQVRIVGGEDRGKSRPLVIDLQPRILMDDLDLISPHDMLMTHGGSKKNGKRKRNPDRWK